MPPRAYNMQVRLDVIYHKSPKDMSEPNPGSVQMAVVFLPKPKGDLGLSDYLSGLGPVVAGCVRALARGGRMAVLVPVSVRRLDHSAPALITGMIMAKGLMLGWEIIWNKGAGATPGSWGGWMSPSNPSFLDVHEHILVFWKGSPRLEPRITGSRPDMSSSEFIEWVRTVWDVPDDGSGLPHEIPKRLIKIYTYPGDIILDPFAGSGTIAAVAKALGRHYIGYEEDPEAYEIASEKLRGLQKGLF